MSLPWRQRQAPESRRRDLMFRTEPTSSTDQQIPFMATIANPVGAFDFAHPNDLSNPLTFDALEQFDNEKGSTMSGIDPSFLQNYFTSSVDDYPMTSRAATFPQSNPSYPYGHATTTASTTSDQPNFALAHEPSNMGSPEMHFPFGHSLSDFSNTTSYMGSAEPSSFSLDQFHETDFPDYQTLLAGKEQQSGFVGEWQNFPQSSSSAQNQNLFPTFSLPSNDPSPFKKPQAKTSTSSSSVSNSPADVSPSFQKALWQSSTTPVGVKRKASTYQHPPVKASRLPQSPQQAYPQAQAQARTDASVQGQEYLLPENQLYASPMPQQGTLFQNSPQAQQSQFFHQTSGNFVAPLESSCWSFPHPFFSFLFSYLLFHKTSLILTIIC